MRLLKYLIKNGVLQSVKNDSDDGNSFDKIYGREDFDRDFDDYVKDTVKR